MTMTIQMIMTIMMMALIMNNNGNDDNTSEGSLEIGQVYSFLDGVPLIDWRIVIPDRNEDCIMRISMIAIAITEVMTIKWSHA